MVWPYTRFNPFYLITLPHLTCGSWWRPCSAEATDDCI